MSVFIHSAVVVALEQQSGASLESLASGGSVSAPSSSAAAAANMQVMMSKRPVATSVGGGGGGGANAGNGGVPYQGLSSLETMQKSVMNAFALKYSECDVAGGVEACGCGWLHSILL